MYKRCRRNVKYLWIGIIVAFGVLLLVVLLAVTQFMKQRMDNFDSKTVLVYSIDDIEAMFIDDPSIEIYNEINDRNLSEFNKLLQYVDEIVGTDKYDLVSLYEVNYEMHSDRESGDADAYVVKIVPENFRDEYYSWGANDSSNPYLVLFHKDSDYDSYSDYYGELLVGLKYEQNVKDDLTVGYPDCKINFAYNPFLYSEFVSYEVALKELEGGDPVPPSYDASVNMFVPYGTDLDALKDYLKQNKQVYTHYRLDNINVCILDKDIDFETIDVTHLSTYSDIVNEWHAYPRSVMAIDY